ncbi:MAG: winged helix-turn-helix transcriptional regulator [Planctomycetes bacterium]|nr:winged helix-turn-helix transcriptional regulator [Planctomycetota bacterium]
MNECFLARRVARSVRLLFFDASSFCNMFLPAITQQLDDACSRIASGRAAAWDLTALVERFGLKEIEFRLLWALLTGDTQLDQTQMAKFLGCSPAQVSGIVERQRSRGNILGQAAGGDRRRQVWRITPQGRALLEKIITPLLTDCQLFPLRVDTPRRNSA